MDILIKNDDFVFSYRVGGILMCNGKILLQRPKNDDYAIIGGQVVAMETSMDYGTNTEAYRLLKKMSDKGRIKLVGNGRSAHYELDHERINLDFCWIPLEELRKDTKVYPLELIPYILEQRKETVHFVSRQI